MYLGIIGCGHIWRTVYQSIVGGLDKNTKVTALCDTQPDLLQEASQSFPDARTYSTASKLFKNENLDGVLILTSEVANARLAQMALTAKVPVYLEKPPAINSHELEELIAAKREATVPLFVAFNRRHTPLLKEWSFPGKVRKVKGVISRYDRKAESFPYAIIHMVDAAQYYAGGSIQNVGLQRVSSKDSTGWKITGTMYDGVEYEFLCLYRSIEHRESLLFETDLGFSEINFPNPEAESYANGRIKLTNNGKTVTIDGAVKDPVEAMGYAPSLRSFLKILLGYEQPLPLEEFKPTVVVLERLLKDAHNIDELLPPGLNLVR